MQTILLIRFGALGDLCLTGWTASRLAQAPGRGDRHVILVTKERFADLAAAFTGVDRVAVLREPGRLADLVRLAARLRRDRHDVLIDAHGVLRSRLLVGLLGRRPRARLRKDTVARLRLIRGGDVAPGLRQHLRDRLDRLLDQAGLPAGPATPPLAHLAATGSRPAVLGLAPGAQWDPKRWPAEHWAALADLALADGLDLRVYLGPREEAWFDTSPLATRLSGHARVELVRGRSHLEVARSLAGCRALVCNDSGLMHLAEAVGTPVVACFGPTVQAFGYAPRLERSRVLEIDDLACRPCSRVGDRPCHRGDLACLVRLRPELAWRTVAPLLRDGAD
ncbi:MAG: glycosyltransferase family 9 protein [Candidatus Krumholzibacteriia bacterium]